MSVALTTLEQARAAADRVGDRVVRTPTTPARVLSDRFGATVFLKRELEQRTGSFKVRGSFNAALTMPASSLAAGLLAFSAGNHAMAVAHVGATLGVPVTVCMPAHAVVRKIDATRALGAEVVLVESDLVGTANRLAAERGLTLLHPFDDPAVVAGHAGVGLELVADVPDVDLVLVPVGGGGLISGVATAAKAINPGIKVIGVEAELYPSMKNVVEGGNGEIGGDTLAEGIAVKEPGKLTRAIITDLVDRIDLVSENDLEHAVSMLVTIEKSVVEGAGAAGLAAILADPERFRGRKVGTTLCGGNIDTHLLANVLVRELVRCGRIARLKIQAQDRPGALAAITAKFFESGVNILETNHQRVFSRRPAKDTVIEVECEARDARAIDTLVDHLKEAGFHVERAELD